MLVKTVINVQDDRLSSGLVPVLEIMAQIEQSQDRSVIIDFSDCRFLTPVFALSLIVYASQCGRRVSLRNLNSYMKTIGFSDGGIKPDNLRHSEFIAIMEGYSRRTYIPIIDFPARSNSDDKEAILSVVENMIIRQSNVPANVSTGIKYIIGETIDNITEHSETDRGFVFAQSYPQKGYLDLCIADRGVTLLGSYQKLCDNEILSDLEAIRAANRGISSKNLPEAENRGYGILTSKKMLVKGLGGQFLMISGSSFYFNGNGFDNFYSLPPGLRWKGTIIALRIPYQVSSFNYINYIE